MTLNANKELLKAAEEGDAKHVSELLASGGDANAKNKFGWTVLMLAVRRGNHRDCAQALITAGADVNRKNYTGETALMRAAWRGFRDCVEALLIAGASVSAKDNKNWTAADYAAQSGSVDCLCLLAKHGAVIAPNVLKKYPEVDRIDRVYREAERLRKAAGKSEEVKNGDSLGL